MPSAVGVVLLSFVCMCLYVSVSVCVFVILLSVTDPEDSIILHTTLAIFEKFEQWAQALQVCVCM